MPVGAKTTSWFWSSRWSRSSNISENFARGHRLKAAGAMTTALERPLRRISSPRA
jgi:hypothetical protein